MKNIILKYYKENSILWCSFVLIWIIMLVYSFQAGQIETHIELNSFHGPIKDVFFKYITLLGGDIPFYIVTIILLFNLREGLFLSLTQLICAIITQSLKYTLCHPRPYTLFAELGIDLPPTVDGVHLWDAYNSFPSGHTSCAFAFFASIAAILPSKYKYLQFIWIFMGVITGFSRIYLSQHFLADVLAGSIIGMISTAITYVLVYHKPRKNYYPIKALTEKARK